MRTIDWVDGCPQIVDQTALPDDVRLVSLSTVDAVVDAIRRLAVRGAPALGVAGAMGVALAAKLGSDVDDAVRRIRAARPTAVNLAWGVDRAAAYLPDGPEAVLAEALAIRDGELAASLEMGRRGGDLLQELAGEHIRVLTHCNTGGLATVEYGTALAAVRSLYERGCLAEVLVSESRPLLQGARLTAWELGESGIAHRLIADSAGPFLMARGQVDAVVLGADRICANGDVVNKIGTYAHALGAQAAGIPFVVVAPESTVDVATKSGADVDIEDRDGSELLEFAGRHTAPYDTVALNPAFDVTPYALVTAIVTDARVIRLDRGDRL
ncbi:MAG: S-methyl-5-thioribose-1-phosphate isomerase [Geodermatophilaceae bacterium]|nr:S-methyl-5-thioribose-1-phosphate isomerase [Geodermatophilaceae bacterium]MDQ3464471.1 S-methyl-5-thioribose-1-phosphate isomerase [Actinomycetota bacterium]